LGIVRLAAFGLQVFQGQKPKTKDQS